MFRSNIIYNFNNITFKSSVPDPLGRIVGRVYTPGDSAAAVANAVNTSNSATKAEAASAKGR